MTRSKASLFVVLCSLLALRSSSARADEGDVGGPGESCRARSDCIHGLRCVSNVCVDGREGQSCTGKSDCGLLECIDGRCAVPPLGRPREEHAPPPPPPQLPPPEPTPPPPPPPPPAAPPQRPTFVERPPIHPFVGVTIAVGFLNGGYSASEGSLWGTGADGSVLLALRGGLLVDRHEISLEIAPLTDFWDLVVSKGPAFEANVAYGYLAPICARAAYTISWPLRLGAGVLAGGANTNGNVFFEARADFIGVNLLTKHWAFELHLPSIRYAVTNGHVQGVAVEGVTTSYLSFFFGTSVSYVF